MSNFKMYIQSLNGVPIDDWGFCAYLGAKKRQLDVVFFEDIEEVPASKFNIVVACIEDTIKYWERLGIDIPKAMNIPYQLRSFTERYIVYTTMKGVRNKTVFPFFIKSKELKKFVAGVVNNDFDLNAFYNFPDETEVMISDYIKIVSEYRCFVIDGEVKLVNHYLGDPLIFPDGSRIQQMVDAFEDNPIGEKVTPAGYSLDVGVIDDGKTVIIECNDGWSLGSYGCDPIIYTNLLIKRWREITKLAYK